MIELTYCRIIDRCQSLKNPRKVCKNQATVRFSPGEHCVREDRVQHRAGVQTEAVPGRRRAHQRGFRPHQDRQGNAGGAGGPLGRRGDNQGQEVRSAGDPVEGEKTAKKSWQLQ